MTDEKNRILKVTCKPTGLAIPIDELHPSQGNLKIMTKESFQKLRKRILGKGFKYPFFVWKEQTEVDGKSAVRWLLIDGHGRREMLYYLQREEDYQLPEKLPCVEIEADNLQEAKQEVLAVSSSYNSMHDEGLYEFMSDANLEFEDVVENFNLPEVDFSEFKVNFFSEEGDTLSAEGGEAEKKSVSFDAYQNASIKQIVLYFAKEDYEKVVSRLDELLEEYEVEDHSQVIWRLLGEKV